ncbi:hypothetical protein B0I21_10695 [Sphingobacterium paludis]|uniref:Uncharacterized protein n=1 Tax=Sphingobacterium paludis TaxID=1476465 RepID=A0A4R7CVM9_9SPHI|nr:hypothetical protein B0I21_10695 [Sphingobacterium paludis]
MDTHLQDFFLKSKNKLFYRKMASLFKKNERLLVSIRLFHRPSRPSTGCENIHSSNLQVSSIPCFPYFWKAALLKTR